MSGVVVPDISFSCHEDNLLPALIELLLSLSIIRAIRISTWLWIYMLRSSTRIIWTVFCCGAVRLSTMLCLWSRVRVPLILAAGGLTESVVLASVEWWAVIALTRFGKTQTYVMHLTAFWAVGLLTIITVVIVRKAFPTFFGLFD